MKNRTSSQRNQAKKQISPTILRLMTEARANAYLIEQGQCRQCGAFLDVVFDGYEAGKGSESWCPTVGCNTSLHFDCYENFSWSDESPSDYEGEA